MQKNIRWGKIGLGKIANLFAEARERNRFLMEGMWTRFIPITEKLLDFLHQKVIGNIVSIKADFGFKTDMILKGRLFEKKLGGGSLMDIGIYPVYLSLLLLGVPEDIKAVARITPSGVDSTCSMLFGYSNSAIAMLDSTLEANTPTEAYIYGDRGQIKIEKSFHHSEKIIISADGQQDRTIEIKYSGNGFYNEIAEVNHCIINNYIESRKLTHKMSLELIKTLERVRQKIGLSYEN